MIYLKCVFCIFYAYFCIQFYCICHWPGFSARAPGPPRSAWHANGSPDDPHCSIPPDQTTPPAPLARLGDHAASTLESPRPRWTLNSGICCRRIYPAGGPAHANKIVRNNKLQKIDSNQRGQRINRAARTIDDFQVTNGREGAHLMTSPMDAK